jgi:hypothetical protein
VRVPPGTRGGRHEQAKLPAGSGALSAARGRDFVCSKLCENFAASAFGAEFFFFSDCTDLSLSTRRISQSNSWSCCWWRYI